ncbi:transketolase [Lachnoclostridium sp. An131]|uniref:transketolase n=1 Tax=Lachnoclostridium sp. An131 TaxID=1965555 RepID=UPI000B38493A|nr:transketolase [Lachnoclostridium sp. An131]OUQ28688.1 transketolase [Lachnoclostridium sp. An131]
MNKERIRELEKIAAQLRITGLKMVQSAHSGHIGGAFSLSEIMAVLYFEKMNIKPEEPDWEDRDRFVLSKGHATVALYPTLSLRGFFPKERLDTFRKIDGHLSGHAEMQYVPGVDMSTGSLGQGFSAAVGMALAARQAHKDYMVYAVLGDGEIAEGQIWEACMFAAANHIDHLIGIVDSNKVQLDGTVKEILDTGDLKEKFESFGFFVQTINGHNVEEIAEAIDNAKKEKGRPSMILADTIKGKGVSFMEGTCEWHGKTPNDEQFAKAFEELYAKAAELEE